MASSYDPPTSEVVSAALFVLNNSENQPVAMGSLIPDNPNQFTKDKMEVTLENNTPGTTGKEPIQLSQPPTVLLPEKDSTDSRKRSVTDNDIERQSKNFSGNHDGYSDQNTNSNSLLINASVKNKFGPLSELGKQATEYRFAHIDDIPSDQSETPSKIPPIIVADIINYNAFIKELKSKVTANFIGDQKKQ